jgi:hypothetical protein
MTQMNKFEDLNGRFASLGTGMTQQRKFRDSWCTLLYIMRGLLSCYCSACPPASLLIRSERWWRRAGGPAYDDEPAGALVAGWGAGCLGLFCFDRRATKTHEARAGRRVQSSSRAGDAACRCKIIYTSGRHTKVFEGGQNVLDTDWDMSNYRGKHMLKLYIYIYTLVHRYILHPVFDTRLLIFVFWNKAWAAKRTKRDTR